MAGIEIFNADCLEQLPLLTQKFDLVYADLPFGTTQAQWDNVIPFDRMWQELLPLTNKNTPIVFHAQQPFTSHLIMSNIKDFKYTWVWHKSKATGFLNAKKRPLVAHEDIVVFCQGTPKYYPQMSKGEAYNKGIRKQQAKDDIYGQFQQVEVKSDGQRYPRSVLYFKTAESEGKTYHKTQKPLELVKYIIETYTKEGDNILDFTAGSGTVGIACQQLKRNCVLIEKDKEIFELMKNRLKNN